MNHGTLPILLNRLTPWQTTSTSAPNVLHHAMPHSEILLAWEIMFNGVNLLRLDNALVFVICVRSVGSSNQASDALDQQNAIFDESGNFLIYCTMLGVKVVNLVTNKLLRMLGRHENVRFLHATLFQVSN